MKKAQTDEDSADHLGHIVEHDQDEDADANHLFCFLLDLTFFFVLVRC